MFTETTKELLKRRRETKVRASVCDKHYMAFVLERHNENAQRQERKENLLVCVERLNKVVNDVTFKFVIWDYGTFYSLQLFEGNEEKDKESVTVGQVNTNWADEGNLYYKRPMLRKRFKSLKGIEHYIMWRYNQMIRPEQNTVMADAAEIAYEIVTVSLENANFRASRAVIFTLEMMVYWEKHKLLPIIQKLYNGKRYNRKAHSKKVISALQQNKIVKENGNYVVYWTL